MASSAAETDPKARLTDLVARTDEMVAALKELVTAESPSSDPEAVRFCAAVLMEVGSGLLDAPPEQLDAGRHLHLRWRFGDGAATPRVLLLGHYDTVWPIGTVGRWPFAVEGARASGPGVFDMKAGVIQALFAVASLEDRDGVDLLITSDEELGSTTSQPLIEEMARGAAAALVMEPSRDGKLKVARKGVSFYHLNFHGRAAHASVPHRGVNAMLEMARQVVELPAVARPDLGTTVTPTLASAGTAQNTVPPEAYAYADVRAPSVEEQERVDREIRGLQPHNPEVTIEVMGGANRPPMPPEISAALFERAVAAARRLGIDLPADGVTVGGGSDGNFTAAVGTPTLDGLGAVGDGEHAEGEYIEVARMPERAALLAELIDDIRGRP
jgi:glutamate carboxypeptidase